MVEEDPFRMGKLDSFHEGAASGLGEEGGIGEGVLGVI